MSYARALRVIGQSLEAARLSTFELETDKPNFVLRSESLSLASEWVLRRVFGGGTYFESGVDSPRDISAIQFTPGDISRLDEEARKQRKPDSARNAQAHKRLSQLLRTLGDNLDRWEAERFHISWTAVSVIVEFASADVESGYRSFTPEKLEQLASYSRFGGLSKTWSGSIAPHRQRSWPPKR